MKKGTGKTRIKAGEKGGGRVGGCVFVCERETDSKL